MKTSGRIVSLILALFVTSAGFAQTASATSSTTNTKTSKNMKTFVIEREIPGAGQLSGADLKSISQKSCGVIKDLGPGIEWVHSYVTDNMIYCIYRAESIEILKEHAAKGGFPINSVSPVSNVISPATAELAVGQ